MKFKSFVYAAMATFLFAACSDSEQLDGTQTAVTTERLADGYVAVQINLPTTPKTRALNDKFDDGTANEYAVTNGALLLFSGADEKTATFKSVYDLNLGEWVNADPKNDNITTSNLVAVQITNPAVNSENLYGLVMLNYSNVVSITSNILELKDNKGNAKVFTGTFADFVAATSNALFYDASGEEATNFFMINAPISSVGDGTQAPTPENITTLVNLTNGIKATKEEATANPAGSFFVERAVAKATLSFSSEIKKLADDNMKDVSEQPVSLTVGTVEWTLNATNKSSYIVRNMGDAKFIGYNAYQKPYRMVGNVGIGMTSIQERVNAYRTYWCYDPTYTDLAAANLVYKTNTAADFVEAGNTPLYCYENTFDVKNQIHKCTTQALIKVQLKLNGNATTFYTLNDREDVIYTLLSDVESYPIGYIVKSKAIKDALKEALGNSGETIEITTANYDEYLDIEFEDAKDGYHKVKSVVFKNEPFDAIESVKRPTWTDDNSKSLSTAANNEYRIAKYNEGVSYYAVRFKHFAGNTADDDLAPWDPTKVGGSGAYDYENYSGAKEGGAENMWLGRYGMVRNNWYDLTVTGLMHLGKPSIEGLKVDSDPTTDDEVEEWIAFKINVLSWAKRTQNVTL